MASDRSSLEATVTSKGQITLPKPLRDRLGLRQGSRIRFRLDDRAVHGEPLTYDLEDLWAAADAGPGTRRTMSAKEMDAAKARRRW